MESSATAWPWIIVAGGLGLAVIIGGLLGPPSFLPGLDFKLLTKTSGVLPSPKLRLLAFLILLGIVALTVLFWWTVKVMTDDHADRIATRKTTALPPIVATAKTPEEQLQCDIEYLKNKGFEEKARFESVKGGETILFSRFEQDANDIWRAEGALAAKDSEPTRFSVAVIYGEGSWVENSATKVRRRGLRRQVKLETVLKDPDFRELSDTNDYILTLGLASNSENEDDDHNWRLSLARAHNIGVAAMRLGWKSHDRIWPQTIGFSRTLAKTEADERKQRPVVLIGVIARRDVSVPDVTRGTMEIVPVNLAALDNYTTPISKPQEPRRLHDGSTYLEASDMNPTPKDYEVRTLKAVEDTVGGPLECSDE